MVFPLSLLRQQAQHSIADLPALKDAAAQVAAHILHGAHGQKKAGGSEKFWQFREYTEADRPQDIDWRQSGKTEHIYVREKELETPQSVYFWANRSKSMDYRSDEALHSKLEAAQIISMALAMLFRRGEERVGVFGQAQVGNSDDALNRIGRVLLENSVALLPEEKLPSKSTFILSGDFLSPIENIEKSLSPLANKNSHGIIVQILDPTEHNLPFDGNVVFEDMDESLHKVDNVASIRDAYHNKISAHITSIEELCASYGWTHILHITDTPLENTLTRIWEGEQR